MDTSDSEYFESADEDIQSDEEKKTITKSIDRKDKGFEPKLQNATSTSPSLLAEVKTEDKSKEDEDIKTKNTNKLDITSECHLISKVENMKIESSSQQHETRKTDSVHEASENKCKALDESRNEEAKKSKIKCKLGSKTPKNLVQFETSPEKNVVKTTDKQEAQDEVKEISTSTENVESKVEEENLWENDELDWGAEAEVESKTSFSVQQSSSNNNTNMRTTEEKWSNESDGWSAWSNWGVSVLSTATQSVSSITSQITNVIETGLGAVDPEELARIQCEERKKKKDELGRENKTKLDDNLLPENSYGSFGLGNLVKLVENTGTKVINGGLDTLETIGKKTMEVLQEGDPGLKKKKAFLKIDQDKPVLSQILREAKERAEKELTTSEETSHKKWKNYETLFDDHHGLVHLEALELLSKQCEIKLKSVQSSMSGDEFTDFSETMDQIKELCELPDEDDEEQMSVDEIKEKLDRAVAEMNVQISCEKLVTNWNETEACLSTLNLEICDENEVHQQAIETLAEMTSRAMEQFHKTGELLLVKERRSTVDEADSLVQITATLISLIGIVAAKFSEKLNGKIANNKEVSGLITNVFFEAANSSSYIQDALQLLIPVLQVGAISFKS